MFPVIPLLECGSTHFLSLLCCIVIQHVACSLPSLLKVSVLFAGDSAAKQKPSDSGESASQKAPSKEAATSAASQFAAAVNKAGECLVSM